MTRFFRSPVDGARVVQVGERIREDRDGGELGRRSGAVLLVGDKVAPLTVGSSTVGGTAPDGEVGHEVIRGSAVPVPLAGRVQTVSPGRISTISPPRDWIWPRPSVTCKVWPFVWACQALRAPGAKRTTFTRTRDGSAPLAMTSNQASPVNVSARETRAPRVGCPRSRRYDRRRERGRPVSTVSTGLPRQRQPWLSGPCPTRRRPRVGARRLG